MKRIFDFFKGNAVLTISLVAAVISAFIVPLNEKYLNYVDWSVIILLFCLMAVVAGLRSLGIFDVLSKALLAKTSSARTIAFILMNLCFFLSMLVTNDVALITFVPLTMGLYAGSGMSGQLIMTVVIETAAANLGSMLTPIGNPQNLFLFRYYDMSIGVFFGAVTIPAAVSYLLLCCSVLLVKRGTVSRHNETDLPKTGWRFWLYIIVFLLCVLSVAGLINEYICLVLTLVTVLISDKKLFLKIDYPLLATFICFFVFVGNIGSISAVESFVTNLLSGRELIVSAALSQIISNVPAAAMLAGFTENATALLRGVNIGGLGTPVASLASLISFRYYSADNNAQKGRYMKVFLALNVILLIIMLCIGLLI